MIGFGKEMTKLRNYVIQMDAQLAELRRENETVMRENERLRYVLPSPDLNSPENITATEDYWAARRVQSGIGFGPSYSLADLLQRLFDDWTEAVNEREKSEAALARTVHDCCHTEKTTSSTQSTTTIE